MTWVVRRRDDDVEVRRYVTEREAQVWIHSRIMPWEFYATEGVTMPTITIKRYAGIFDEEPVETIEFESESDAIAWLNAQDGTLNLQIEQV